MCAYVCVYVCALAGRQQLFRETKPTFSCLSTVLFLKQVLLTTNANTSLALTYRNNPKITYLLVQKYAWL